MEELIEALGSWEFTFPIGLWIGGALLLLLALLQVSRERRGLALDLQYWAGKVRFKSRRVWVMTLLIVATSVLMASALADPQVVVKKQVSIYGKPVMLVIDVSGSMEYRAKPSPIDGTAPVQEPPSNIEKARAVFYDILSRDLGMDFGVLLYSTEHYIARYFAFKKDLVKDSLDNEEEIAFISSGTRTAGALALARSFLTANVETGGKAILLISDMQGDLEAMVAMAEEMENCTHVGIKVYAVIIQGDDAVASSKRVSPPSVVGVMMVDMNDKWGIDQLCREMAALEDSPVSEEVTPVTRNVTSWLAAAALGLVVLSLVLSESRFRKIP